MSRTDERGENIERNGDQLIPTVVVAAGILSKSEVADKKITKGFALSTTANYRKQMSHILMRVAHMYDRASFNSVRVGGKVRESEHVAKDLRSKS